MIIFNLFSIKFLVYSLMSVMYTFHIMVHTALSEYLLKTKSE
jgi:hypothetical protein